VVAVSLVRAGSNPGARILLGRGHPEPLAESLENDVAG
jgi:hypothetical protein